jgi:hypothetical protein
VNDLTFAFFICWFMGLSRHEAACAQAPTAARQHPNGQGSTQEGGGLRETEALKPLHKST